jgi:hypothetical protein
MGGIANNPQLQNAMNTRPQQPGLTNSNPGGLFSNALNQTMPANSNPGGFFSNAINTRPQLPPGVQMPTGLPPSGLPQQPGQVQAGAIPYTPQQLAQIQQQQQPRLDQINSLVANNTPFSSPEFSKITGVMMDNLGTPIGAYPGFNPVGTDVGPRPFVNAPYQPATNMMSEADFNGFLQRQNEMQAANPNTTFVNPAGGPSLNTYQDYVNEVNQGQQTIANNVVSAQERARRGMIGQGNDMMGSMPFGFGQQLAPGQVAPTQAEIGGLTRRPMLSTPMAPQGFGQQPGQVRPPNMPFYRNPNPRTYGTVNNNGVTAQTPMPQPPQQRGLGGLQLNKFRNRLG